MHEVWRLQQDVSARFEVGELKALNKHFHSQRFSHWRARSKHQYTSESHLTIRSGPCNLQLAIASAKATKNKHCKSLQAAKLNRTRRRRNKQS